VAESAAGNLQWHAREARQRQHGSWLELLADEPIGGRTRWLRTSGQLCGAPEASFGGGSCSRLPRASDSLVQTAARVALAGPISRLGRAGRPHRPWSPHGDEHRIREARVPVGDRVELYDHRLVDGERVRPAAADGLQRRRVREPPRAAGRLRVRRRGGAGWSRLSWGGMTIAGAWHKARWSGDRNARSRLRERGSGGQAANRRLGSSGGLSAVQLGRVNGSPRAVRVLDRASNRPRAV
jgi:hypothetical protein